jgi:cytochrome c oxidase assembly protein subunit 15
MSPKTTPNAQQTRGPHRLALLTAIATLALIGVGGLVTSHGVGLSVPDWPNTYGYNMFFFPVSQWVGGIFYEHSHRLVASGVGLLTTILALWLYGTKARSWMRWPGLVLLGVGLASLAKWPARVQDAAVLLLVGVLSFIFSFVWPRCAPAPVWLRRLGLVALIAVVLQGVLGGLRVTVIKDELGIFHAALAQLFFGLICALALFTSRWWEASAVKPSAAGGQEVLSRAFVLTTVLIFAQLTLGATMRHQHAGLAIPDFPLAYGKIWPDTDPGAVARYNQQRLEITAVNPITEAQIILQMAHRGLALLICIAVSWCAWSTVRRLGAKSFLGSLSLSWVGLILLQVVLGVWTIWSKKAADIATAHVTAGALALALGAVACIVCIRKFGFARNRAENLCPSFAAESPTGPNATAEKT